MGNSLYNSIEEENIENIDLILKKKPNLINEFFNKEKTSNPIARAVWRGSIPIVKFLISKRVDINIKLNTTGNFYPILIACWNDDFEMVKLLIENDVNLFICDGLGYTPLDYCIIRGFWKCSKLLYNQGLKPKSKELYEREIENFIHNYVNYELFINELLSDNDYTEEEARNLFFLEVKGLKDPVYDPRETWKEYVIRTLKFEQAPLIERNDLPKNLRPENRNKLVKMLSSNKTMLIKDNKFDKIKSLNENRNENKSVEDIEI